MGPDDAWRVPGKGERTRDALVRAGVDVLVERGWAGLTVRAVAERAGTPPSLLGYHFDDVRRFRHAVVEEALDDLFAPLLDDLWRRPTWPRGLAAVVRTLQEDVATEQVDERVERAHDEQAELEDDGVHRGLHEVEVVVSHRVLVAELVAAVDGLLLHERVDPGLPLDAVVAALLDSDSDRPGAGPSSGRLSPR